MHSGFYQDITQDKLDDLAKLWARMIACIVHDLTTPLVVMRMAGTNLSNILPTLMAGYKVAVDNQLLTDPPLKEKYIRAIESNFFNTAEMIVKALTFLDSLFPFCKQLLSSSPETMTLSAKNTIETAVKNYIISKEEKHSWVHLDCEHDFQFHCASIFIECLFQLLLTNAIKSIQQRGEGNINISTKAGAGINLIYFEYSVPAEEDGKRLFDQFFFKKGEETLPGLGFCRLALVQRGGDICYRTKDNGSQFIIQFPTIKP